MHKGAMHHSDHKRPEMSFYFSHYIFVLFFISTATNRREKGMPSVCVAGYITGIKTVINNNNTTMN